MNDSLSWHKKYHQMVKKATSPEFLEVPSEIQRLHVGVLNHIAEQLGKPVVELQEQGYCLKSE